MLANHGQLPQEAPTDLAAGISTFATRTPATWRQLPERRAGHLSVVPLRPEKVGLARLRKFLQSDYFDCVQYHGFPNQLPN